MIGLKLGTFISYRDPNLDYSCRLVLRFWCRVFAVVRFHSGEHFYFIFVEPQMYNIL